MSVEQATKTQITPVMLRLLGVEEQYIRLMNKAKILPCTLGSFMKIEGNVCQAIQEALKTCGCDAEGRLAGVAGKHGSELFIYHEDHIEGRVQVGDDMLRNKYNLDGRTLSQDVTDIDGNSYYNMQETTYNDSGKVLKTVEVNMVATAEGFTPNGENTYEYLYNEDGHCVSELINGEEARLHEWQDGLMVKSTDNTTGHVQEFTYDEHGMMVAHFIDGNQVVQLSNTYNEVGAVDHIEFERPTGLDANGNKETETVVVLDLAEFRKSQADETLCLTLDANDPAPAETIDTVLEAIADEVIAEIEPELDAIVDETIAEVFDETDEPELAAALDIHKNNMDNPKDLTE